MTTDTQMLEVNNLRLERENKLLRESLWDGYFKAACAATLHHGKETGVAAAAEIADEMLRVREARIAGDQNPIKKQQKAASLPTLGNNSFVDPNIASVSLALWTTQAGRATSAVQLLVRPNDVRGDESGELPDEEFVMLTIVHEELLAMAMATGGDIDESYGMLYEEWFRLQQGVAYDGSYAFAKAAWHAAIASLKGGAA